MIGTSVIVLSYLRNENLTKTEIVKTITENQYLLSTSTMQSSSNTKEPQSICLEMVQNCNIYLTRNNKSKPSDSQTRDNNSHAIANNNNKKSKNI